MRTASACSGSGGKGSDAPTGRGRFPASSSQSGICAAVSAQSGTIIGAGAALDCQRGVPLLCAPALQFQSGTRIPVMPLWGARAECGEGNCRSYYLYKYKCEPVDIVIASIDLASDLGRCIRQTR